MKIYCGKNEPRDVFQFGDIIKALTQIKSWRIWLKNTKIALNDSKFFFFLWYKKDIIQKQNNINRI